MLVEKSQTERREERGRVCLCLCESLTLWRRLVRRRLENGKAISVKNHLQKKIIGKNKVGERIQTQNSRILPLST